MYEKGLMDERKAAQYYARIESGEEADVAAFADVDVEEHNRLAQAGIARTTLRTGDVPRGIGLAVNSENSALQREWYAPLTTAIRIHKTTFHDTTLLNTGVHI